MLNESGCSIPAVRAFTRQSFPGHSIPAVRALRVREDWVRFPMPRIIKIKRVRVREDRVRLAP